MSNKQIIIDGCDVSGCEHLYREIDCLAHIDFSECCEGYNPSYGYCPNIDCYYKQLKRKEQECEELKKTVNEAQNSGLDLKSFLVCEAVQNEYEQQLKAEKETLKQYKASKQASYEALQKRCNELELENRKLEAENDILTWQRDEAQKHQYCLAYDATCLTGNEKCIYSTCVFKSIFKLKALVQDIKHIAEDQKDVLESMRIDIAEQILNKISEVIDEEVI